MTELATVEEAVIVTEPILDEVAEDFDPDLLEEPGLNSDLVELERHYQAEELAWQLVQTYRQEGLLDSTDAYSDLVNFLIGWA